MLKAKVDAVNKLHAWLNEAIPELLVLVHQGYSCKTDGSLYKKDAIKFKEITDTAPFRASIDSRYSSLSLRADITYKTGDHTVEYYKRHISLTHEHNILPYYTLKEVRAARLKHARIKEQIRDLENKICQLPTLEG